MRAVAVPFLALLSLAALADCGGERTREAPVAAAAGRPALTPSARPGVGGAPGTISGTITLVGPVPQLQTRPVTVDAQACGKKDHPNRSLSLGAAKGIAEAVVTLDDLPAAIPAEPTQVFSIDQKGCEFLPRVQIIPPGARLVITNSDPVNHNARAADASNATIFNLATPVIGSRAEGTLSQAGPVRVKCDVHPWMIAWVYVAEHPAVITDAAGHFVLTNVPPGPHRLRVWHELLTGPGGDVTVESGKESVVNAVLSVDGRPG
ncbi:MAG: carboxypeptidase regulatory-like domain-containing protein [Thermoanaerobaculia bacterium]